MLGIYLFIALFSRLPDMSNFASTIAMYTALTSFSAEQSVVTVSFDEINEITEGTPVFYEGHEIGFVKSLKDRQVTLLVESPLPENKNAVAVLISPVVHRNVNTPPFIELLPFSDDIGVKPGITAGYSCFEKFWSSSS